MATKKSGGYDKTKLKKVQKTLESEINQLGAHLKKLKQDVEALEKGDGKTAYWSGTRAYTWYKNILAHYDHDIQLKKHAANCNLCIKMQLDGASTL